MHFMYIKYYFYIIRCEFMKKLTVKARSRPGTKSLELTIPVCIVNSFNVSEGDVFSIEVIDNTTLILKYERVYSNR